MRGNVGDRGGDGNKGGWPPCLNLESFSIMSDMTSCCAAMDF